MGINQNKKYEAQIKTLEGNISLNEKRNRDLQSKVERYKSKLDEYEKEMVEIRVRHQAQINRIHSTHKIIMGEANQERKIEGLNMSLVKSKTEYEQQIRKLNDRGSQLRK